VKSLGHGRHVHARSERRDWDRLRGAARGL